jgi:hypothetical protein
MRLDVSAARLPGDRTGQRSACYTLNRLDCPVAGRRMSLTSVRSWRRRWDSERIVGMTPHPELAAWRRPE